MILGATIAATGTYTVTVTGVGGCSSTAQTTVAVSDNPLATASNNSPICSGDSLILTSGGGTSYIWSGPNSFTSALQNPVILGATIAATGTYIVTVTMTGGCSSTTQTTVIVNPLPDVTATPSSQTICSGSATGIILTSNVSGASFVWTVAQSGVTGATAGSGSSIAQVLTNSGTTAGTATYTITPTANVCAGTSINVVITVNPLPIAPVSATSNGDNFCSDDAGNITLTATGGSGTTFYWYTGSCGGTVIDSANGLTIPSPTTTTIYYAAWTNACGTSACASVTVNVLAAPVANAGSNVDVCFGENVTLTATGGGSYLWNTGDTTATISFTPAATVTYIVTVTSLNECTSSDDVVIIVNSIPTVMLYADPENFTYTGLDVTFTAIPAGYENYNFYVDNTLMQSGNSNIYITNTLANAQVVSVIASEDACDSPRDSIDVIVKPIPNAFTPYNIDGKNDIFAKGFDLVIINRWGQELYSGKEGWDGKYNGTLVTPGVYYYIIKYLDVKKNTIELKGVITVVN